MGKHPDPNVKLIRERPFRPAEGLAEDLIPHSSTALNGPQVINIPESVNAVLMQARIQNVHYTLSGNPPTAGSGFALIVGNDPLVVPISPGTTVLTVIEAVAGAILEMQFGFM